MISFGTFFLIATVTCGPIVLAMQREARHVSIWTMHDPEFFSADLLGPWIPDWTWLYHGLTRPLWNSSLASYVERSVCLGPAVIIAAAFALFPRRRRPRLELGSVGLFVAIALIFIALCFGPTLRFRSVAITRLTPYRALSVVIPSLRFGGCPGRMIIMAQLAVSVLAAAGLSRIKNVQSHAMRVVLATLVGIAMVIESQPRLLLTSSPQVPRWVEVLRDDPAQGALIDLVNRGDSHDLYYQTVHHRPIAMGAVSRVSAERIRPQMPWATKQRGAATMSWPVWGLTSSWTMPAAPPLKLPLVYQDRAVRLYRCDSSGQK